MVGEQSLRQYKMDRIIISIALQRAEQYEKQGNKEKADHFLNLAAQAEEVYDRIEKNGGLNEQFRSTR